MVIRLLSLQAIPKQANKQPKKLKGNLKRFPFFYFSIIISLQVVVYVRRKDRHGDTLCQQQRPSLVQ